LGYDAYLIFRCDAPFLVPYQFVATNVTAALPLYFQRRFYCFRIVSHAGVFVAVCILNAEPLLFFRKWCSAPQIFVVLRMCVAPEYYMYFF